jgi:hypothetical protein
MRNHGLLAGHVRRQMMNDVTPIAAQAILPHTKRPTGVGAKHRLRSCAG